jgi:hypothetical protein
MNPEDTKPKDTADDSAQKLAASAFKEHTNNLVAVTVAVLAVFMAITKVTDDNVCQAMQKAKANEVDTWSYYQAKSVKQNLAELGRAELAALSLTAAPEARTMIEAAVKKYEIDIARYETDMDRIKKTAEDYGKEYDRLNYRDDQFDFSDATLSISLGMLAVTALTGKRWLLKVSWGIGGSGALLGIAGLTGMKIHSDWLAKLLS